MEIIEPDRKVANKVLRILKDAVALIVHPKRTPSAQYFFLEPYDNGREHGYVVTDYTNAIIFSENRNTDQIVLYYGMYQDTQKQSCRVTERMYRSALYFNYNDYHGVVAAGLEHLLRRDLGSHK